MKRTGELSYSVFMITDRFLISQMPTVIQDFRLPC